MTVAERRKKVQDVLQFNPDSRQRAMFARMEEGGHAPESAHSGIAPKARGAVLASLEQIRVPDGGFSIHARTGESPKDGFMAAHKGSEYQHSAATLSEKHINRYADRHASRLSSPDVYMGDWHDPEDGVAYLDVSRHFATQDEATKFGKENGQKSIFDVLKGESIKI